MIRQIASPQRLGAVYVKHVQQSRRIVTRAEEKSAINKAFGFLGFDTDDGYFGFTPFAEKLVGRAAIIGMLSTLSVEKATGNNTLSQLGVGNPNIFLTIGLCFLFAGVVVGAGYLSFKDYQTGKMSLKQRLRFQQALLLENEASEMVEAQEEFAKQSLAVDRMIAKVTGEIPSSGAIGSNLGEMKTMAGIDEEQQKEGQQQDSEAGQMIDPATGQFVVAQPQATAAATITLKKLGLFESVEIVSGRLCMMAFILTLIIESYTGYGFVRVFNLLFQEQYAVDNFFDMY